MEKIQINYKELFKVILIICLYFLLQYILSIPVILLMKYKIVGYNTANLILYILLTLTFFLIYIKTIIKDFKDFKKRYKEILKITFRYWFIGYLIMMVSSNIINILHLEENTNQAANIDLLRQAPLVEILCASIFAPILEELVFRRGLKKSTNNKYLYAIVTGLIFGLIHVTSSIESIKDIAMLLYIIPYGALGTCFGLAYSETDNIFGTIAIHSMHNTIAILILILFGGII